MIKSWLFAASCCRGCGSQFYLYESSLHCPFECSVSPCKRHLPRGSGGLLGTVAWKDLGRESGAGGVQGTALERLNAHGADPLSPLPRAETNPPRAPSAIFSPYFHSAEHRHEVAKCRNSEPRAAVRSFFVLAPP